VGFAPKHVASGRCELFRSPAYDGWSGEELQAGVWRFVSRLGNSPVIANVKQATPRLVACPVVKKYCSKKLAKVTSSLVLSSAGFLSSMLKRVYRDFLFSQQTTFVVWKYGILSKKDSHRQMINQTSTTESVEALERWPFLQHQFRVLRVLRSGVARVPCTRGHKVFLRLHE